MKTQKRWELVSPKTGFTGRTFTTREQARIAKSKRAAGTKIYDNYNGVIVR